MKWRNTNRWVKNLDLKTWWIFFYWMTKSPSVKVQKNHGRFVFSAKTWLYQLFYPFYFIYHPSTCKSDARHTCALLKSFAGLWRTSNKYKLCPTKIDRSLTMRLYSIKIGQDLLMGWNTSCFMILPRFLSPQYLQSTDSFINEIFLIWRHTFSAFWLRSSVVSVLISLISDTGVTDPLQD